MAKIIDAHMHLGEDLIYNSNDDEARVLGYMEEFGIDGVLLQPGLKTYDWRKSCERIRDFAADHPGVWHTAPKDLAGGLRGAHR